jgi:uncharacterized membrane protein YfcA
MGYGTTLTPILLIIGFPVKAVIAAALLSQVIANCAAAFFHHQQGNVDFWREPESRKAVVLLGGVGVVTACITTAATINMDASLLRTAVTVMVVCMGVFMLFGATSKIRFSSSSVALLAAVAGFNKAFCGGGYGPLVAGGQVLSGVSVHAAIAITAVAEALVCSSAIVTYFVAGGRVPLYLLVPLVIGAVLSTPISAFTLRRLPASLVKKLMGAVIVTLGVIALIFGKGV